MQVFKSQTYFLSKLQIWLPHLRRYQRDVALSVSKLAVILRTSLPQTDSFIGSTSSPRMVVIFLEILVLIHHRKKKKKGNEFSSAKSNAAGKISTNQFSVEIFPCWLNLFISYWKEKNIWPFIYTIKGKVKNSMNFGLKAYQLLFEILHTKSLLIKGDFSVVVIITA